MKTLVREYLDLEESRVKVGIEYMENFGKILPPVQLIHLFQLENKAEAAFKHDLPLTSPCWIERLMARRTITGGCKL